MASSDNSIQEKAKEKLDAKKVTLSIIRVQSQNVSEELPYSPGTLIASKKPAIEKEKNEDFQFSRHAPKKSSPAEDISHGLFPLMTSPAALFHHSMNPSPVRSPEAENANSLAFKK